MKTNLYIGLVSICCLFKCSLEAQQILSFSDYREHRDQINPGAVFDGFNNYHNLYLGLSFREQSFNASGPALSPRNFQAKGSWIANRLSSNYFKPMLGTTISSRQIGPTHFNQFQIRLGAVNFLNTRSRLSQPKGYLSAALSFSIHQIRINASETIGLVPDDPLLQADYSRMAPNVGFGVFYQSPVIRDKISIYAGASMPQFFKLDLRDNSILGNGNFTAVDPQYYGLAGMRWYNASGGDQENFLECSALVAQRTEPELFYDANLRYYFGRYHFWLGTGYSSDDMLHTQIGLEWYQGWTKRQAQSYKYKQPLLRISLGYDFNVRSTAAPLKNVLELNVHRIISTR